MAFSEASREAATGVIRCVNSRSLIDNFVSLDICGDCDRSRQRRETAAEKNAAAARSAHCAFLNLNDDGSIRPFAPASWSGASLSDMPASPHAQLRSFLRRSVGSAGPRIDPPPALSACCRTVVRGTRRSPVRHTASL